MAIMDVKLALRPSVPANEKPRNYIEHSTDRQSEKTSEPDEHFSVMCVLAFAANGVCTQAMAGPKILHCTTYHIPPSLSQFQCCPIVSLCFNSIVTTVVSFVTCHYKLVFFLFFRFVLYLSSYVGICVCESSSCYKCRFNFNVGVAMSSSLEKPCCCLIS